MGVKKQISHLTPKKKWFNMILSGEKKVWILRIVLLGLCVFYCFKIFERRNDYERGYRDACDTLSKILDQATLKGKNHCSRVIIDTNTYLIKSSCITP